MFLNHGINYQFIKGKRAVSVVANDSGYCGDVIIPKYIVYQNTKYAVWRIGDGAFEGCKDLKSIVIPDSVFVIGHSAFSDCISLSSVTMPDSIKFIFSAAFSNCTSLETITIPNNVKDLSSHMFMGCSKLKEVILHNHITTIGAASFVDCSAIEKIVIPSKVNEIDIFWGITPFNGCNSLKSIIVDKDNTIFDSRDNCNAIINISTNTLLIGCDNTVIPNTVSCIGEGAFSSGFLQKSIFIPDGVIKISSRAFYSCPFLEIIILPKTIMQIDSDMLTNCEKLKHIFVPKEKRELYLSMGLSNYQEYIKEI